MDKDTKNTKTLLTKTFGKFYIKSQKNEDELQKKVEKTIAKMENKEYKPQPWNERIFPGVSTDTSKAQSMLEVQSSSKIRENIEEAMDDMHSL